MNTVITALGQVSYVLISICVVMYGFGAVYQLANLVSCFTGTHGLLTRLKWGLYVVLLSLLWPIAPQLNDLLIKLTKRS